MKIPLQSQPGSPLRSRSTWAIASLLLVLSGCALCDRALRPSVPPTLEVPAGQRLLLKVYARGVQIYVCESNPAEPGQVVWKLKAPEAMLFNESDGVIGSHYAGPTWELHRDGSKVIGAIVKRVPSPDATAIPWLLVEAKGTEGMGQFHHVTYIQRVNTQGGLPPTIGGAYVGQEVRSRYTADYFFYCNAP